MDKQKGKRMSLNPAKNNHHIPPPGHTTEVEVQQTVPDDSHLSLSSYEHYNSDELGKAFRAISKGQQFITAQSLYSLLHEEGFGELYLGVQMIAMVDKQRKGYINQEEFREYFSDVNYVDEQKVPPLPEELVRNRKWVARIQQGWGMQHFLDPQYCAFVSHRLSNRNNR